MADAKILVVDDDKKIVELVTLYLKKDGYQVLAAFDGRQAIELARRRQPDLIVLDLMLPQVDGTDVCRVLRAESEVPIIMLGDIVMDFVRHEVQANGQVVNLTPTEFRMLEVLVKEPGRAFSRLELLEQAFGYDYEGLERTVDVHIMNLRKKIETEPSRPRHVVTVPGVGYRFKDADAA
jgi:DNA-binding response OmpR family regulator